MFTRKHASPERRLCRSGVPRKRVLGLSLLEVSLYMTLAILLGIPLVTVLLASTRSTAENDTINRITERNRATIFRIEKELRTAIASTVMVGDSGRSLTFTLPSGFDGTSIIPGATVSFSLQPAQSSTSSMYSDPYQDPYYDPYSDPYTSDPYYTEYYPSIGSTPSGELVMKNSQTGTVASVGSGIDIGGSGFALNGAGVTVTIASVGSLHGKDIYRISNSVTVHPRN